GNVGYHAASLLAEYGAKIITVIEKEGSVVDENGIDIEKLNNYFIRKKTLQGYNGFTKTRNRFLTKDCDILVPAATESVIHKDNAKNIKAKLIVEAGNGPVTAEADRILIRKGVIIIPDFYANAGGVVVSYFEWVKNLSKMRYGLMQEREDEKKQMQLVNALELMTGKNFPDDLKTDVVKGSTEIDLVRSGLEEKMREGYKNIHEKYHSDKKIKDFRTAAMVIAIKKIADAYRYMGI
ncbi:glutamate dehydrogenase, partial [Gammaproteobacteria bacterium]|nr:glutamate dehydrogenase [Gammaproteobacteria bacterium]